MTLANLDFLLKATGLEHPMLFAISRILFVVLKKHYFYPLLVTLATVCLHLSEVTFGQI